MEQKPESKWKKRGAQAAGSGLTLAVAIWGYTTFIQKEDAEARFESIKADVVAVETRTNTSIQNSQQLLINAIEGMRLEQRKTNERIDRILERLPRHQD